MIQDTQRAAYDEIQPTVSEKRARVLAVITKSPSALFDICSALGWPVNRVSGRVTELAEQGLIEDSGSRKVNPASGKKGIVWRAVEDAPKLPL
jgi:predicted transcriptional regulator